METKLGVTLLIVGGYVLGLGLAGVNATSGGVQALYGVVLALGCVIAGWAVVLPWDGEQAPAEQAEAGTGAKELTRIRR